MLVQEIERRAQTARAKSLLHMSHPLACEALAIHDWWSDFDTDTSRRYYHASWKIKGSKIHGSRISPASR